MSTVRIIVILLWVFIMGLNIYSHVETKKQKRESWARLDAEMRALFMPDNEENKENEDDAEGDETRENKSPASGSDSRKDP